MAELVGGAFLSSFLQVALERLASRDFLDYFSRKKLDGGLLKNLKAILLSVDKIVEDAEETQYRDDRVKQWLVMLKDEVFTAQDLLDDIATDALRHKLDAESQTAASGKVRGFFTSLVNRNQSEKKIESGIKEVINNLENLMKQKKTLGLREGPSAGIESGVHMSVYKRLPTTRLIDESDLYGRDADKERIVKLLLSQNKGGNQLPMDVIAITGMGGMGKTTLAKLVFEDVRVKDRFEHRAWVCVSEEFDVDQVTKATLQSLNCPTEQLHDLHSYQLKLEETLMGKKFFLVLDDVWNENCKIWEVFQAPLKHAAPQSKILITTRNQKVAEVMCCTFTHSLKPLKDGDVWNLFAKHAFNNQHHDAGPDLLQIGRKIVKRCGGLPLAIKTLGSLLHRKLSFQYWDKILKSEFWELSENDSNIVPSLRLSYHYLPSNLKRCFAYCSLFPKDYDIDKNVLIQLWMADGLIDPPQKSMSLEEAGNEMLNDLESRSFFEPSRKGDGYFVMHDLVNDLAKSVTQEFFVQQELDQGQDMSTKARHFSHIRKISGNHKISEEVFKCHRLRTFLLLDTSTYHLDVDIMSRLSRLKYMRELSLRRCRSFKNLTEGISNLKHLHYLDLSWTSVGKLPNSMCLLINLQTLKLRGCQKLNELPSNFYKLINLRHLDLKGCGVKKMPKYMGKLNQLRTMNKFVAAKEGGSNIKELGALKNLTGSLSILNMKCIKDAADMREANLKEKQLHTLKLRYLRSWTQKWQDNYNYSREEAQHQEQVWEALELNHNVKHLTVEGYRGNIFPKWHAEVSHFLPNLVSLVLRGCLNIESLPPLGQLPSLQRLTIEGLDGIKVIGEEFYGNGSSIAPFPRLSYLEIENMRNWEKWDICYEGESFPNLVSLVLRYCPNIESLPPLGQLPSLQKLTFLGLGGIKVIGEEFYGNGSSIAPFPRLSYLEIENVRNWEKWDICYEGESFPNLVSLVLRDCPNIESLPPLGQLPSLQKLTIEGLNGIKVIGEEFYGNGSSIAPFPRLSYLEISRMEQWEEWDICYEGESFPCLEELHIRGCSRLKKSLPQHLPCLKTLHIEGCKNLEATLPKSSCMEELLLYACEKITVKDMPTWSSSDVLPPLHDLQLIECRAMESLPQGGMLSSLQRLSIRGCSSKLIESVRDWGLHELLSLKELTIGGIEDMECFPEEGLLPPNLQSLSFFNCNMKRINHRGLVHLHSLTSLEFFKCPSMSFEGMPEDGLPPSLSHLLIGLYCPLLEKRCEKEKGPDWPIIAHIPHIDIH